MCVYPGKQVSNRTSTLRGQVAFCMSSLTPVLHIGVPAPFGHLCSATIICSFMLICDYVQSFQVFPPENRAAAQERVQRSPRCPVVYVCGLLCGVGFLGLSPWGGVETAGPVLSASGGQKPEVKAGLCSQGGIFPCLSRFWWFLAIRDPIYITCLKKF